MNELPVQMHPKYPEFLAFMTECPHRKTPSTLETAFWAWSKKMSELCGECWLETGSPFMSDLERIDALKKDLDRKHRECAELQKQLSVLSEHVLRDEWIVDYAIWQAIHDLESRCRHYPTGLEIKVQDKANSVPVEYALKLLEMVGVEMIKNDHFPNVKIIYDKASNPLFGKN